MWREFYTLNLIILLYKINSTLNIILQALCRSHLMEYALERSSDFKAVVISGFIKGVSRRV